MKKQDIKFINVTIVTIDALIAVYLYLNLNSLMHDINVITVPARLFLFAGYFGFGIILSILSALGSIKLIKISGHLINILTISSVIILLLSGVFVVSILPYE